MSFHPSRTIAIVMIAKMLVITAIAQEMPRQSFAQQNATGTQAPGQNVTAGSAPPSNQTVFVSEGNATTLTMNRTVIPLQMTTIKVVTVTKTVDSELMSRLQNITVTTGEREAPSLDLSHIQNQTITGVTGQAISTIIARTDVPYNVTTFQFTSTTGQNQTFTLNPTAAPEQVMEQLFNIPQQQMPGNQTTQNSTSAGP